MMIWPQVSKQGSLGSNIITTIMILKVSNRANTASCLRDLTTTPISAGTATKMKKMKLMKKWAHLAAMIYLISKFNNKKEKASSKVTTVIG